MELQKSNLSNATQMGALKAEALSQIKCNPREVDYWIRSVENAPERTPAFAYATSRRL